MSQPAAITAATTMRRVAGDALRVWSASAVAYVAIRLYPRAMCRSIKTLRRADEAATTGELEAAARQYVRKISGYRTPSARNAEAFESGGRRDRRAPRTGCSKRSASTSRKARTAGRRGPGGSRPGPDGLTPRTCAGPAWS